MPSCLAIDVAKGKSMVTLVSSCGEVLIDPYEVDHSIMVFLIYLIELIILN